MSDAPNAPEQPTGVGQFPLEDLLRFGLSGGVFVLSIAWLSPSLRKAFDGQSDMVIGAGITLLSGAFVYSLHRALLHPVFERALLWWITCSWSAEDKARIGTVWKWNPSHPTRFEEMIVKLRWMRRVGAPEIQSYLHRWSSQTHFLYTIPVAYWLACVFVCGAGRDGLSLNGPLVVASILVFSVALLDDARLKRLELMWIKENLDKVS